MFDKYEIKAGPSRVDIHEHRAPTDDAARLYGELLAKARAEVIESLAPKNSLIDVAVIRVKEWGGIGDRDKILYSFDLNGCTHRGELKLSNLELLQRGGTPMVLFEILAELLAAELVKALAARRAGE